MGDRAAGVVGRSVRNRTGRGAYDEVAFAAGNKTERWNVGTC
jgi:hypothetical protein